MTGRSAPPTWRAAARGSTYGFSSGEAVFVTEPGVVGHDTAPAEGAVMKNAKYLVLGALAATPAVVVLAVHRAGPSRAGAATITDGGRSQWEYRVMHERELISASGD